MDKLIGEVSNEQIAEWKKLHKQIHAIEVGGHVGYVKRPGRLEMSQASVLGANDPIAFNENLLGSCWLGGSDAIKTDDELFLGAGTVLGEIVHVATATIKNL